MDEHDHFQGKEQGFGEKQAPMSSPYPHAGMTPPPSYHSFDDGLWTDQANCPGTSFRKEARNRSTDPGAMARHPRSRNEEVTINHRSRDARRKHHRSRTCSSSHNSAWIAKLVFQGLKSNLFGSGDHDPTNRESKGRTPASRMTKLDIANKCRHVHYAIHNHWPESDSEPVSRAQTWPDHQQIWQFWQCLESLAGATSGALPAFGVEGKSAAHGSSGRPTYQDHLRWFRNFDYIFNQCMDTEELSSAQVWKKLFDALRDHPSHGTAHSPHHSWWWDGQPQPEQACATIPECARQCPEFATASNPNVEPPSGRSGRASTDTASHGPNPHDMHSTNLPKPEPNTPDPSSALAAYNIRWDYIDTVQQPFRHELPWPPTIRPNLPFDHTKCDVFAFFARAFDLQPDGSKAPRLDFELSPPRSPYPSYDHRQQESEKKMLKMFKQQMQREKLRWHEDKLTRKFPGIVGSELDERRKAVWAAIAEGSAVCDRRLISLRGGGLRSG